MVRRMVVVLALVLSLAQAAHAAVEEIEKFGYEGWVGSAVAKDGKFYQCVMWSAQINNWDVGLSLEPSGDLWLALRTRKIDMFWPMVFDQLTALRIQVDQGPVLTRPFKSITSTLISTSLKGTDWDKRLPGGTLLRLNTGNKVRLFHLEGIKEAWPKLVACVARHRGT